MFLQSKGVEEATADFEAVQQAIHVVADQILRVSNNRDRALQVEALLHELDNEIKGITHKWTGFEGELA